MEIKARSYHDRISVAVLSYISLVLLLNIVILTPFIQMTGNAGDPFKQYRIYGYILLAVFQVVLILKRGINKSLRSVMTPTLAALVWFSISLAWADHIEIAGKRVGIIILIYSIIFSVVYELGYQRSLKTVRIVLGCILILNFIVVLAFPHIGVHSGHGQWKGLMANKNIAGIVCATTVILFNFDSRRIPVLIKLIVTVGALLFIFLTGSRTPLAALPIACIFGFASKRMKIPVQRTHLYKRTIWVGFIITIAGIIALTLQRDFILSLTDDIGALSLRNAIWRPMIIFYLDHPILGSGYGSYWNSQIDLENVRAFSNQEWMSGVDQGHNGYLDLLVQTGVVGLGLALYSVVFFPLSRVSSLIIREPFKASLIVSLVVFLLVENLTETSILSVDVFGNVMLLFCLSLFHRLTIKSDKSIKSRPSLLFKS